MNSEHFTNFLFQEMLSRINFRVTQCTTYLRKSNTFFTRLLWTGEVQNAKIVSRLDEQTEVIQYVSSSPPPLSDRDHCLLRYYQHCPNTIARLVP